MKTIKLLPALAFALSLNHAQGMKKNDDNNKKVAWHELWSNRYQNQQGQQAHSKLNHENLENTEHQEDTKQVKQKDLNEQLLNTSGIDQNLEAIKSLIEEKADMNCKNKQGLTLLHGVCKYHKSSLEIIKYLIDNKANVSSKSNNGSTALHTACIYYAPLSIIKALLVSLIDTKAIVTYLCHIKKLEKQIQQIFPKPLVSIILNDAFKEGIKAIKNYINDKNAENKTALGLAQYKQNTDIENFLNELLQLLENGNIQKIIFLLNS